MSSLISILFDINSTFNQLQQLAQHQISLALKSRTNLFILIPSMKTQSLDLLFIGILLSDEAYVVSNTSKMTPMNFVVEMTLTF